MSNGVAPISTARDATWLAGTNRNSASGSTNFLMSHGHATLSTFTFSRVIHFITSFLQLLIQPPKALRSLEFLVLQIGVVYHLGHLQHRLVCNCEPLHQRLECAIISMVREFHVRHVERQRFWMPRSLSPKNKLRLRINEPPDQPCRSGAVNPRSRTRQPRSPLKILGRKFGLAGRPAPGRQNL